MMTDICRRPTGTLSLTAIGADGRELWHFSEQNLIVASGYKATAQALVGEPGARIDRVGIGTNGAPAQESDTAITNMREFAVITEFPDDSSVAFNFTIDYDMEVGMKICEFGLITADGRLFSRKVREVIEKTQYMSIVGRWVIKI